MSRLPMNPNQRDFDLYEDDMFHADKRILDEDAAAAMDYERMFIFLNNLSWNEMLRMAREYKIKMRKKRNRLELRASILASFFVTIN